MSELPPDVAAEIDALCAEADGAAASGALAQAIAHYEAALDLLPAPAGQWSVAPSLWSAVADARFRTGDLVGALEPIALAMQHGDPSNPFLHLRRGQCLLGMGHRDAALDALARAFVGGGRPLFAREDPRYLAAVRELVPPRPGEDDP